MTASDDFIIVHTVTEKTIMQGKKSKVSKSETYLLKRYVGCDEYLVIPKGITNIGYCVFRDCKSLKTVVIPEGVKTISSSAFMNCENLKAIYIPGSIQMIQPFAFEGCNNLRNIYIEKTAWNFNGLYELKNCKNAVLYGSGCYFREFAFKINRPYVEG